MSKQAEISDLPLVAADHAGKCPALAYVASLSAGSQPATKSKLRKVAKAIFAHEKQKPQGDALLSFPWSKLRFDHVEFIRSKMQSDHKAPSTINATLVALRSVADFAYRYGQIDADTLQRIRMTKSVRGRREPPGRYITREDRADLLRACRQIRNERGARDLAIMCLGFYTGIRRVEFAQARIENLYTDRDGDYMLKFVGKGNNERSVLIEGVARIAMDSWLSALGDPSEGPLFCGISRHESLSFEPMTPKSIGEIFAKRAAQAGIDPAPTTHDMRRTFASDMLDEGVGIGDAADVLGHASIDTTRRYDMTGARRKKAAQRRTAVGGGKRVLKLDHKGRER